MLRYAGSLALGLAAVLTVFVVMQSFVVGHQFQLAAAGASDNGAGVLNLGTDNGRPSQITAMPEKAAIDRPPPLPADLALAQPQLPDLPLPNLAIPNIKLPFNSATAESLVEETASGSATPAASPTAPAQQQTLAVGNIVLVQRVEPKYPIEAARQGLEGSVTVKFTVETDGSVSSPSVISAKPRRGIFDEAALRAVARWKFQPLPAPQDTTVTLDFKLQGGG